MKSSGARPMWFSVIARKIMDGGPKPPSFSLLCLTVPGEIATAINDGHMTAAKIYGEERRNDFRAGQEFFIREVLDILQAQGFIGGDDRGYTWLKPADGVWQIEVDDRSYSIFGQKERRLSGDREFLGERPEEGTEYRSGRLISGQSRPFEVTVLGPKGGTERRQFEVHPLAFTIPPMTEQERETLRASIARDGVKMPLTIYEKKVLEGRNRLYFASELDKPVRIVEFEGTQEEARRYVMTVNIARRHLTVMQQAILLEEIFGETAREQAAKAADENRRLGDKNARRERSNLERPRSDETSGRWPDIASRMAEKETSIKLPPKAYRAAHELKDAPETKAKARAGEIATPHEARKEAAKEKGLPAPLPSFDPISVNKRLNQIIKFMTEIISDHEMPAGKTVAKKMEEQVNEIEQLAPKLRPVLRQRRYFD
jgi:hypothetical protein